MAKVGVVVPAAGRGTRMNSVVQKQYLELAGIPIVGYALKILAGSQMVNEIVLVTGPGEEDFCRNTVIERLKIQKIAAIVPGGSERQESVFCGLLALSADTDIVVIHDAARPLLKPADLKAVVEVAEVCGAATLAVPVKDTVKLADGKGLVERTLPRERLWLTQTPQAFHYDLIIRAHLWARQTGYKGTDDASLVEALGEPVQIVAGSYANLKITTPEDLLLAATLINKQQ